MSNRTRKRSEALSPQPFELGITYMTHQIADELTHSEIQDLFMRHIACDWSDMDDEDRDANALATFEGTRIFSSFRTKHGKIWIITEADRSSTGILFPSEY